MGERKKVDRLIDRKSRSCRRKDSRLRPRNHFLEPKREVPEISEKKKKDAVLCAEVEDCDIKGRPEQQENQEDRK